METLTWIICFIFALIAWIREKNLVNPAFIISALFGFMMLLTSFHLNGLNEVSIESIVVIIIGIVSFNIAFWIRRRFKFVFNPRAGIKLSKYETEDDNSNLETIFFILSLISVAYALWKTITAVRMLFAGQSLDVIRSVSSTSFDKTGIYKNLFDYLLNVYVISVFRLASISFGISYFLYTGFRCKKVLIVAFINVLLCMLSNGGRSILIEFMISFLGTYWLFRKFRGTRLLSKKIRRRVLIFLAFSFIVIVFISNLRKDSFDIINEIYTYFGNAIPFMDYHIENFNTGYTYGYTFLYGLIRFPVFLLHQFLRIPYSSIHSITENLNVLLQSTQKVGTDAYMNAFATIFFFFYVDGGVLAVGICSFIYGYYSCSVYSDVIKDFSIRNIAIYCICISAVLCSYIRFQYYSHQYVYSVLFLQLLMKKNGKAKIKFFLRKKTN